MISARFSVPNIEKLQGVEHLNQRGYAVFSDILINNEINNSVDLLGQHLEGLKRPYSIRHDDPRTWDQN